MLIFLLENKYGSIKSRTCTNGSVKREWMQKEEKSSNTAYLESIMLTSMIDAKGDMDVVTLDIPNHFIHTPIDRKPGENKITMKTKGVLVDILAQMYPENMILM